MNFYVLACLTKDPPLLPYYSLIVYLNKYESKQNFCGCNKVQSVAVEDFHSFMLVSSACDVLYLSDYKACRCYNWLSESPSFP